MSTGPNSSSPLPQEPTVQLQTRLLREQVYEHLREQMARGTLQPGGFLDLNDLAARLGISRTPLREALLYLESQGFVSIFPRRGFRINPLTLEEIRSFYEIIGALEAATLRRVGPTLQPADLRQMRDLDAEMARAVAARDFDRYYAANLRFHDVYLARSSNKRLVAQVHLLKRRLYDWPRRERMLQAWERHSVAEHEDFLRLLEAGSIDAAAAHLRDVHWSFEVQEPYIHAYYFGGPSPESAR